MNRKLLPALLLTSAAIGILGCEGAADDPKTSETDMKTQPVSETEAETEPCEWIKPDLDMGGMDFTIGAVDYYTTGLNASVPCEVFSYGENGEPINDAIFKRIQTVEEAFHVNLEMYSLNQFVEVCGNFRTVVQANEDVMDFALVNGNSLPTLMTDSLLLELNDMPGLNLSASWWDQNSIKGYSVFDHVYGATGDISLLFHYSPVVVYFNKYLISSLDLEDPYQLVYQGKWTLDKMVEMCRKTANDLDGDGSVTVADRFGICCEPSTLIFCMFSSGIRMTEVDSDGIPQFTLNSERTVDYLDKISGLFNDKSLTILSQDYVSAGYSNVFKELLIPMFMDNRALFFSNQLSQTTDLRNMNADFGILPLPKFDEAQDSYYGTFSNHWSTFAVVPVTNTIPEITSAVMDALGYYGQRDLIPTYVDKTVRYKSLRDEDSAKMLDLVFKNQVFDIGYLCDFGGLTQVLGSSDGDTFASSYASAEKSAISQRDSFRAKIEKQ